MLKKGAFRGRIDFINACEFPEGLYVIKLSTSDNSLPVLMRVIKL